MSRNFEILQRAGRFRGVFATEPAAIPRTGSGAPVTESPQVSEPAPAARRLQLDLEGHAREEAIRLVHRVFLAKGDDSPRSVVFSGVERDVGCTWSCAWAARALAAHVSGTVCAVDANLRSPSLHREFGLSNSRGLVAALSNQSSVLQAASQLGDTNLWILPSGTQGSDLSRVCTPLEMDMRLNELQSHFDYVLLDSPAMNRYADALALGQMCDGLVLVMDSSSTQRTAAQRAKQNANAHQVRVFGVVLTKCSRNVPELVSRILR